jgi:hypothetical protein
VEAGPKKAKELAHPLSANKVINRPISFFIISLAPFLSAIYLKKTNHLLIMSLSTIKRN